MANFQVSTTVTVTPTDGPSLSKSLSSLGMNAKDVHDDVHPAGSLDLAPMASSIANPRGMMILAEGDGVKLKFDGAAAFTTKAFKTVYLEVTNDPPGPAGLIDLEVDCVGAAQRIRVIVFGDPD